MPAEEVTVGTAHAFQKHTTLTEDLVKYLKREVYAQFSRKAEQGEFVILDIGCGNGRHILPVVEFLHLFGSCRLYAIEENEELLEECKAEAERRGVKNVLCSRGRWEDGVPKGKADIVLRTWDAGGSVSGAG